MNFASYISHASMLLLSNTYSHKEFTIVSQRRFVLRFRKIFAGQSLDERHHRAYAGDNLGLSRPVGFKYSHHRTTKAQVIPDIFHPYRPPRK